MTPTATALLAYASWFIILLLCLAFVRTSLVMAGKRASNSFAPSGDDMEGFAKRLTRAHANCYENMGLVAAVLLYAIATNQTALTDGLAYVFLGARIAQSAAHLIATNRLFVFIRFAFFVVQVLILIYWLLKLFHLI
ncbi:MAPEG family protein [Hyphococcus luteus]|uniref:MAPEG family protein n=1 Tax=Hyphococcus luteus TaxID=2058213 RepID=A0A2S7KAA9_9PROT|nr:MAPEG family protein [Marinicaulis flavus]PQA89427.1 MAPEG family protein [Marinicaulis flavus]